jgi:hypothetical protein
VAYELGLRIKTGHIVWFAGLALKHELDPNERVPADKGYCGEYPAAAKTPRTDLVAKVGLETPDQLAFELKLRMRHSLGKDIHALEHGFHSSHLDLSLFQVIAEPMVFDCN